MREFEDKVFLSGSYVGEIVRKLKSRLEYAIVLCSVNQQIPPPIWGYDKQMEKAEQEIEDIVKDIAMALTGKEIEFKGK